MGNTIKYIAKKTSKSSYTKIPIGADSVNVDRPNGKTVETSLSYLENYITNYTPNLVNYQYVITAEIEGQQDFLIPLDTFNKETDTIIVAQNRSMLATDDYFVLDNSIRLVEGVTVGTTIFITIFKNVPVEKGSKLIAGDLLAGYYGKVNGLITGADLCTEVGLTAGTLSTSGDITWLKFSHNYKTLLIASSAIRNNLSWDDIQAQDLVKGKTVEIGGRLYLCRLMTGGNSNPASNAGGEWDDLIVQFTPNSVDCNWEWNNTICQEIESSDIKLRVARGAFSVTSFNTVNTSTTYSSSIWRPVLELL